MMESSCQNVILLSITAVLKVLRGHHPQVRLPDHAQTLGNGSAGYDRGCCVLQIEGNMRGKRDDSHYRIPIRDNFGGVAVSPEENPGRICAEKAVDPVVIQGTNHAGQSQLAVEGDRMREKGIAVIPHQWQMLQVGHLGTGQFQVLMGGMILGDNMIIVALDRQNPVILHQVQAFGRFRQMVRITDITKMEKSPASFPFQMRQGGSDQIRLTMTVSDYSDFKTHGAN